MTKDLKDLVRAAERQGFTVKHTRKRHLQFISPTGKVVTAGGTLSDHRAVANIRSYLRKAGFVDR